MVAEPIPAPDGLLNDSSKSLFGSVLSRMLPRWPVVTTLARFVPNLPFSLLRILWADHPDHSRHVSQDSAPIRARVAVATRARTADSAHTGT